MFFACFVRIGLGWVGYVGCLPNLLIFCLPPCTQARTLFQRYSKIVEINGMPCPCPCPCPFHVENRFKYIVNNVGSVPGSRISSNKILIHFFLFFLSRINCLIRHKRVDTPHTHTFHIWFAFIHDTASYLH